MVGFPLGAGTGLALSARGLVERRAQSLGKFRCIVVAQKCRKNNRGCSSSMWLWTAVVLPAFLGGF